MFDYMIIGVVGAVAGALVVGLALMVKKLFQQK
jgi:hypothetical protein